MFHCLKCNNDNLQADVYLMFWLMTLRKIKQFYCFVHIDEGINEKRKIASLKVAFFKWNKFYVHPGGCIWNIKLKRDVRQILLKAHKRFHIHKNASILEDALVWIVHHEVKGLQCLVRSIIKQIDFLCTIQKIWKKLKKDYSLTKFFILLRKLHSWKNYMLFQTKILMVHLNIHDINVYKPYFDK